MVAVHGYRTFDDLVTAHGRGRGCDVCKPAVASILASQLNGHVLDESTVAPQDTNDAYLANIQRNGNLFGGAAVPGGEITPDRLIVIGEVARDFALYTKITGGQRIDLLGARLEQLPAIWRRLVDAGFESGHAYGKSLRTVKSCVGSTWCRVRRAGLGAARDRPGETRYRGLRSPHKIKAGVSGCARECAGRPGARTSARSPPRRAAGTVRRRQRREPRATRSCSPPTSTPRRWSGTSTGSSCTTSAPLTGCSAPAPDRRAGRRPGPGPRGGGRRRARSRRRARGRHGPARRHLLRRVAGHSRTPRSSPGSSPSSTPRAPPTRRSRSPPSAGRSSRSSRARRRVLADRRRLHPGGRAMTATETLDPGLHAGRARGRAGRRGAGPRAGGGDLPHPRRHGVRAGQPRPVQLGGRDRPRHRRHPRGRALRRLPDAQERLRPAHRAPPRRRGDERAQLRGAGWSRAWCWSARGGRHDRGGGRPGGRRGCRADRPGGGGPHGGRAVRGGGPSAGGLPRGDHLHPQGRGADRAARTARRRGRVRPGDGDRPGAGRRRAAGRDPVLHRRTAGPVRRHHRPGAAPLVRGGRVVGMLDDLLSPRLPAPR